MIKKKSLEALLIGLLVLSITGGIVFTTMSLGAKGQQAPRKSNNLTISDGEDNNEELEREMEDENSSKGGAGSGSLKDGEYEGTARGYSSDITVRVIIRAGKIFDIEVLSQAETPEYFQYALSVLDDIIDRNSTDVDSVSGATISSDALKEAVSIALEKAGSSEVSGRKSSRSNKSGKSNRRNGNVLNKNRKRVRNRRGVGRGSGNVPTEPRVRDNTPNEIIEDGMFKDGKYEGSAYGFKSYIKVLVTIEKGKISNVEILSHGEDYSYFSRAKSVVNAMIGGTSADVDSVSGATYSSNAIINAVNEALSKALVNPSKDSKEKEKIKPNAKVKPNPGGGRPSPRPNPSPSPSPGPSPGGSPRPDVNKNIRLVDGSYEGSAYGYRSIIKVSVKVKDGKIASVEVLNHGEDYPYFGMARDVINRLIGRNNTDVDSVSRATYSSNGIIKAVRDCLLYTSDAADDSPPV